MKDLPVPINKQKEVIVNYAIAKFMRSGIAFKSKEKADFDLKDVNSRCWIKYFPGNNEFHLTLRFSGTDYITGKGTDNFDIDLYIPWEDFELKFNEIKPTQKPKSTIINGELSQWLK